MAIFANWTKLKESRKNLTFQLSRMPVQQLAASIEVKNRAALVKQELFPFKEPKSWSPDLEECLSLMIKNFTKKFAISTITAKTQKRNSGRRLSATPLRCQTMRLHLALPSLNELKSW